jgi:hypothetical protein
MTHRISNECSGVDAGTALCLRSGRQRPGALTAGVGAYTPVTSLFQALPVGGVTLNSDVSASP